MTSAPAARLSAGFSTSVGENWKPAPTPSSRYESDCEPPKPLTLAWTAVCPSAAEPKGSSVTLLLSGSARPIEAPRVNVCDERCVVVPPLVWDGPKPRLSVPPGQTCHTLRLARGIEYPTPPPSARPVPFSPS